MTKETKPFAMGEAWRRRFADKLRSIANALWGIPRQIDIDPELLAKYRATNAAYEEHMARFKPAASQGEEQSREDATKAQRDAVRIFLGLQEGSDPEALRGTSVRIPLKRRSR